MEIYNGKIVYKGNKVYVDNTTYTVNREDTEIVTKGTCTITLPSLDGTVFDIHLYISTGTTSVTGNVDGVTNPSYTASNLEYDIFCNGSAYYTVPTEKDNFFVNSKSQNATIQTFSQTGVIAVNTVLMTIDCRDCTAISISALSIGGSGVVTPRWLNETGDTAVAATIMTPAGVGVTTFNAAGIWVAPVCARYLQLVLTTATTTGTTTIRASKLYGALPTQLVPTVGTQAVSGTVTANQGNLTNPTTSLIITTAGTNVNVLRNVANTIYCINVTNVSASPAYIKLYNNNAITVGSTVNAITIPVPANSNIVVDYGIGIRFTSALTIATTANMANNDTTGVGAGDLKIAISYI